MLSEITSLYQQIDELFVQLPSLIESCEVSGVCRDTSMSFFAEVRMKLSKFSATIEEMATVIKTFPTEHKGWIDRLDSISARIASMEKDINTAQRNQQ